MSDVFHRIVFLDRATVKATFRPPSFPHEWIEYAETPPDAVAERLENATVAITNKVRLGAKEIAGAARLRMIAVAATGVDVIELAAARARNIVVANVRGYANTSVAEHTVMLMLALRRNLIAYRGEDWSRANTFCLLTHDIEELSGSVLGVIGYGTLGRAVAQLGAALGMRVMIAERKGERAVREGRATFDEVLATSDVLSLHAPLNEATRGMIGAGELAKMKPSAVLINTARGGLVDEAALAAAIRTKQLAGCAFDVLEKEPPRSGSPLLEVAHFPQVIMTPHIAWASRAAMQRLADRVVDNIEAFARAELDP